MEKLRRKVEKELLKKGLTEDQITPRKIQEECIKKLKRDQKLWDTIFIVAFAFGAFFALVSILSAVIGR